MATKKTWKWARRVALTTYRKALKAAEAGAWGEADCLTDGGDCAFCDVQALLLAIPRDEIGSRDGHWCTSCRALTICQTMPDTVACEVHYGLVTSEEGLARLRSTIAHLEALEVTRP